MHMKSTIVRAVGMAALSAMVLCGSAFAWGPRAQQSVSLMAMQVVKKQFPSGFKAGGTSYEKDCLNGAVAGIAVLQGKEPLGSDAEAVQAVGTEIQLLREVREYGTASYFAYRMGVLSALVANVMTPYGFVQAPGDEQVAQRMFADIEQRLDGYDYTPAQTYRDLIRDPLLYFQKKRTFLGEDYRLIGEDYRSGRGYDGFLKQGGEVYFVRSVEAVADAWATVLSRTEEPTLAVPSRRMQTWYFVDEIEYLLLTKKNPQAAERAYENFHKVVQSDPEAYERIGDSYAAWGGEEGTERGVREWQNAHSMAGPNRANVAAKLNKYYLSVGNKFLDTASKPGADDNDLPSALRAFESALEFDRRSDEAADLIQKTHVLINERNARHDTTLKLIASAEKLTSQADGLNKSEDFGGAIKTYRQAMSFYASIGDEFKEESRKGKEGVRSVKTAINGTVKKILDRGSTAIDDGEKAEEDKKFDEAVNLYAKVEAIVSVIPEENITGNKQFAVDKREMIELSKQKMDEAKKSKAKYEEQQRLAAEAAKKGGKKPAAPGAAAPAAPAAPPAK
jgi:hypothetical protein